MVGFVDLGGTMPCDARTQLECFFNRRLGLCLLSSEERAAKLWQLEHTPRNGVIGLPANLTFISEQEILERRRQVEELAGMRR
jgi:hypothetical protein